MKTKVFLTQTDTTIGFVSKSKSALDKAKKRAPNKVYITALPSLNKLNKRIPKIHKLRVRRAKKTTFILSSTFSFRAIKDKKHNLLLNRLGYAYTSSANQSNREYYYNYAYENADIIVYHPSNSQMSFLRKQESNQVDNNPRHSELVSESQTSQPFASFLRTQESKKIKPSTIYKLGKTKLKKIR